MNKIYWQNIPWKLFYKEIATIQGAIVTAYTAKHYKTMYQLQRKLVVSLAARAIAVCTNSGTGVGNVLWDTPAKSSY